MSVMIAAIDPGLSGAIAILDRDTVVLVDDIPVHDVVRSGRKLRSELDLAGLRGMLAARAIGHVFIEDVGARPGQGVVSMFRFGYAAGAIAGVVTGLQLPMTFVNSRRWQKAAGIGPAPDEARQRASQLYPEIAGRLTRKKDGHRGDAILIARYGASSLQNGDSEGLEPRPAVAPVGKLDQRGRSRGLKLPTRPW
jgi:crossover junction endodeoxyribonuclease RuvC